MFNSTLDLKRRILSGGLSLILAASMCSVAPQTASAVTSAEKQAEADAALEQLNELQDELDIAEANYHTAVAEQETAQARMEEAQERIDDAQKRIDETQAEISKLQGKLGTRARSMYRSGASSILDLIFGATTFEEFISNWDLLTQLNENDADMTQRTKDLKAEIEEEKAAIVEEKKVYEEQERVAAEKAAEAAEIEAEAQQKVNEMQATYDSLTAEVAALLEEERIAREAAEAAAAQAAIEAAAAAEAAAASSRSSSSSSSSSGNSSSGTSSSYSSSSSSSSSYTPAYSSSTGNTVVDRAYAYVGNATYVWGACSPGQFDCSGFVSYCLTGAYSRLGTTYTFLTWPQVSNPQPGDVCVSSTHCGIYIGGGQMIHAAGTGRGVIIGSVPSSMIYVRYAG